MKISNKKIIDYEWAIIFIDVRKCLKAAYIFIGGGRGRGSSRGWGVDSPVTRLIPFSFFHGALWVFRLFLYVLL